MAYHPQANGMVERFHCQLKDSLRSRLSGANWSQDLPWIMLGLRITPKESSTVSSAEILYTCTLNIPGDFLDVPERPPDLFL